MAVVAREFALEFLDSVLEAFDVVDERLKMLLCAGLLGCLAPPCALIR